MHLRRTRSRPQRWTQPWRGRPWHRARGEVLDFDSLVGISSAHYKQGGREVVELKSGIGGAVAIVTGGGSGIGEATVRLLAAEGARVVVADRTHESADRVVEAIRADGGTAVLVEADVSRRRQVEAMVQTALDSFGRLDILVNAAGRQVHTPSIAEVSEEEWDRVMDVNLKGVFLCTKAALPVMAAQGHGSIVNVSSASVLEGGTFSAPYSVSKAGVEMLTKVTSSQYRPMGVRVNCILPGLIDTPGSQNVEGKLGTFDSFVETIPTGRAGQPEEVARLILFLVSEDSAYISGTSVVIDGGRDAR